MRLVLLALCFAQAANAASLTMTLDRTEYQPGSLLTLRIYGTSYAPEASNQIIGNLFFDPSLLVPQIFTQNVLPGGGWVDGGLSCISSGRCLALNQVRPAGDASIDVTDFLIARIVFSVLPSSSYPQALAFDWQTTPTTGQLRFFGLTSAPGVTATIVPEPSAAALVALGLLGLALAGRGAQRTRMVAAARR